MLELMGHTLESENSAGPLTGSLPYASSRPFLDILNKIKHILSGP